MRNLVRTHRTLELAVLHLWSAGYRLVHLRRGDPVWILSDTQQEGPHAVRATVTGARWPYRTQVALAQDVARADLPEAVDDARAA